MISEILFTILLIRSTGTRYIDWPFCQNMVLRKVVESMSLAFFHNNAFSSIAEMMTRESGHGSLR